MGFPFAEVKEAPKAAVAPAAEAKIETK
jgi:hypothetical protein